MNSFVEAIHNIPLSDEGENTTLVIAETIAFLLFAFHQIQLTPKEEPFACLLPAI